MSQFTSRPECRDAFGGPRNDAVELGGTAQRRQERAVHRNIVVRVEPAFDRLLEQTKRRRDLAGDREALAQMERDVRIK